MWRERHAGSGRRDGPFKRPLKESRKPEQVPEIVKHEWKGRSLPIHTNERRRRGGSDGGQRVSPGAGSAGGSRQRLLARWGCHGGSSRPTCSSSTKKTCGELREGGGRREGVVEEGGERAVGRLTVWTGGVS